MLRRFSYDELDRHAAVLAGRVRACFPGRDDAAAPLACHPLSAGGAVACLLLARHIAVFPVAEAAKADFLLDDVIIDPSGTGRDGASPPLFGLLARRGQDTPGVEMGIGGPRAGVYSGDKMAGLAIDAEARIAFPWGEDGAVRSTADAVRARLNAANAPFRAGDNISEFLQPGESEALENEVAAHASALLRALVIDLDGDAGMHGAGRRIARMYLREAFCGRYAPPPKLEPLANVRSTDDMCVLGPLTVRSTCAHHLTPMTGRLWIGLAPDQRVVGLSKFTRLVDWVMRRPQIQEQALAQLADRLQETLRPQGLILALRARHMCMTWRGVQESDAAVATSLLSRGIFREDPSYADRFIKLAGLQD